MQGSSLRLVPLFGPPGLALLVLLLTPQVGHFPFSRCIAVSIVPHPPMQGRYLRCFLLGFPLFAADILATDSGDIFLPTRLSYHSGLLGGCFFPRFPAAVLAIDSGDLFLPFATSL